LVAKIAQAGLDENGLIWPGRVLRESAHRFEGRPVYPLHEARLGGGRHPSSIDRWGYLKSVQYLGTDDDGYLAGLVVPHDGRIEMLLREAAGTGRSWGLSAHVGRSQVWRPKEPPEGCPHARVLLAFDEVTSVDLVERPAMPGCRILTESYGAPYDSTTTVCRTCCWRAALRRRPRAATRWQCWRNGSTPSRRGTGDGSPSGKPSTPGARTRPTPS
jgi:hypothetical protein